ncbi:MAG: hypothetical protein KatS3mg011_0269 [Acidimicrobiia bacterium]|nr:MAG: hypothetical protein KatS3mg011_0269 [Acidimicrobiia bacterium]
MNETPRQAAILAELIGFNLTFAPMHWLGLQGMVRRTWRYAPEMGLGTWNLVSTIGSFIIALAILVFIVNWTWSRRRGALSGIDPWDARTIEWTIPNPTPEYNFATPPVVRSLDDFWHMKYNRGRRGPGGQAARRRTSSWASPGTRRAQPAGADPPAQPVLLPPSSPLRGSPSWRTGSSGTPPLVGKLLIVLGAVITVAALIGWSLEPLEEPEPAGAH